jgi:hypothetical protein
MRLSPPTIRPICDWPDSVFFTKRLLTDSGFRIQPPDFDHIVVRYFAAAVLFAENATIPCATLDTHIGQVFKLRPGFKVTRFTATSDIAFVHDHVAFWRFAFDQDVRHAVRCGLSPLESDSPVTLRVQFVLPMTTAIFVRRPDLFPKQFFPAIHE